MNLLHHKIKPCLRVFSESIHHRCIFMCLYSVLSQCFCYLCRFCFFHNNIFISARRKMLTKGICFKYYYFLLGKQKSEYYIFQVQIPVNEFLIRE